MTCKLVQSGATGILYDADRLAVPAKDFLSPAYWQQRGVVTGTLRGRGTVFRVETAAGPAVLRRFLRGGIPAGLLHDRYLYTGQLRSRAFREWQLLAALHQQGLPVPAPLAASCERAGVCYRAGLLTAWIADSRTLAEQIAQGSMDVGAWRAVGATLRRFHDAGVAHADLNARNILFDGHGRVHLLDFDRGRLVDSGRLRRQAMLQRLRRSLEKCAGSAADSGWQELMKSYNGR